MHVKVSDTLFGQTLRDPLKVRGAECCYERHPGGPLIGRALTPERRWSCIHLDAVRQCLQEPRRALMSGCRSASGSHATSCCTCRDAGPIMLDSVASVRYYKLIGTLSLLDRPEGTSASPGSRDRARAPGPSTRRRGGAQRAPSTNDASMGSAPRLSSARDDTRRARAA